MGKKAPRWRCWCKINCIVADYLLSAARATLAGMRLMVLSSELTTMSCPCRAFSSSMRRSEIFKPNNNFSVSSFSSFSDITLDFIQFVLIVKC